MIDEIIKLEWEQFDKVQNEGGRAECQDDFNTFSIMRKSQFMIFERSFLESYRNDLLDANRNGRNLITEKYARMMASTAPYEYEKLEKYLPVIDDEQKDNIEKIVSLQVGMMEEFAKEYPNMAGNARSIHSSEDNLYNTSYETYLRGELLSYSPMTVKLYLAFVNKCVLEKRNIAKEIMTNTALLYGYKSLEDAEESLV